MWVSYISLEAIAHRLTGGKKGLKRSSAPRTGFSSMKSYQKDTVVQEAQRLVEADEKKRAGKNGCMAPTQNPWGIIEKYRQAFTFRPLPGRRVTPGQYCSGKTTQPPKERQCFFLDMWMTLRSFAVYTANARLCWGLYWLQGIGHWVEPPWAVIFMLALIEVWG